MLLNHRCRTPLLVQLLLCYSWTGPQLPIGNGQTTTTVVPALTVDNTAILNVSGHAGVGSGWTDSYSVGNACYCITTFDHDIGEYVVVVDTPDDDGTKRTTTMTIRDVCAHLGPGPGEEGRPVYNDIQCGNGPPNTAGDEHDCPGRTDHGQEGCKYIGPKWNFFLQNNNNNSNATNHATTNATTRTTTAPDDPTVRPDTSSSSARRHRVLPSVIQLVVWWTFFLLFRTSA